MINARLKEKCYITMGQSPSSNTYNTHKKGIAFLQGRKTFGRIYPNIDTWTTDPKRIADENTVLLSVRAPVGDLNIANQTICIGRGLASIKMKNANNKYLYYLLLANKGKIMSNTTGTVFESINKDDLENIELNFLNEDEQIKIAKILSTLDDKIELNNQINNNLYEITKQLYKRWFVDFEFPNEKGNSYKSDGGKMIESELGKIPESWIVKRLDEISINFDSKRKPLSSREREEKKGVIPYYGATSIIDYVDDYLFDDIYVLMGEDGTVINTDNTPVLQYIWRKCWVNNHAHILQGKSITTEHLMECLRSTDVSSIITGAVQLKINQVNMNSLKYVIASDDVNQKFENILSSIYAKIRENIEEKEDLIKLRDTLLPKLMNGEIDLENIEI